MLDELLLYGPASSCLETIYRPSVFASRPSPLYDDSILNFESSLVTPLDRAIRQSFQERSRLPLIKQELRCKIQCGRTAKGEPETVTEDDTPKTYQLREDEIRKKNDRLRQNRESAWRSREKLKTKEKVLRTAVDQGSQTKAQLEKSLAELRQERNKLTKQLQEHLKVCPNRETLQTDINKILQETRFTPAAPALISLS